MENGLSGGVNVFTSTNISIEMSSLVYLAEAPTYGLIGWLSFIAAAV